jgi:hypothetical protein
MFRPALLALLIAAPAAAQVYALSPAEKAAAIEAASRRPDADNPALLPGLQTDRGIHGEFGAMIGSGGARGFYGIIGMPLGERGSATIAFSDTRSPRFYGQGPFGAGGQLGQRNISLQLNQPGW